MIRKFELKGKIMTNYVTEQRKELIDFFKSNPDVAFSAKEIAARMPGVSLSAIYRNLARLEKNGEISRSVKDGCREIYYSYVASEHCRGCLHLTCEKCGTTVHMSHIISDNMISALTALDGFTIDNKKSVIYGICSKCQ